jgi:hypothetical protein
MTGGITVLPGSARIDLSALRRVAADFGWAVDVAHNLSEAAAAQALRPTVAVLFSSDALGPGNSWIETIRLLRAALPKVRLVACHSFTESIDWPELCDAGAFHALWLPLKEDEVRRTLGFIWAAESSLQAPLKNHSHLVGNLKL